MIKKEERRVVAVEDDAIGAVLCNICCFSYNDIDMFTLKACENHKYCRNCMKDYL